MTTESHSTAASSEAAVREAVERWAEALNAMLGGDPEPLAELYSHADDVVYMGAEGTYRVGWEAAYADWSEQAAKSLGGTAVLEDVHVIVQGDLAFASHNTRSTLATPAGGREVVTVRETSAFRREDGAWRMVAHHADRFALWEQTVAG